ncbi:MAG: tRNA (guanosine(37)-N1)-methyltransferase TrmD [Firmicutes bacterium]|nr:tRNA (guanosine(37)-N1)-methyltransferase TrmD [Bacillota bacterium]
MKFHVLTLFTKMVDDALSESIIGRARKNGTIELNTVDIRDFSEDKHNHVDDYPYGGGNGMVMQPGPVYRAYKSLGVPEGTRVVYMTPQGRVFSQKIAEELSKEKEIVILCGHYEGIDERVIEEIVTDEISVGDFVLSGGELGAMIVVDAVSRLIPGVLGNDESSSDESFSGDGLLEYPQYTRPPEFLGRIVPEVLLSGHHANIDKWRRRQSFLRTLKKRPDLIDREKLSDEERRIYEEYVSREEK